MFESFTCTSMMGLCQILFVVHMYKWSLLEGERLLLSSLQLATVVGFLILLPQLFCLPPPDVHLRTCKKEQSNHNSSIII